MPTLDEILDYAMRRMSPQERAQMAGPRNLFEGRDSASLYARGIGLGGTIPSTIGGGSTNVTVQNNQPRPPSPAVAPMGQDEAAQVRQAGFAQANSDLAPLLSDWRTTPAAALTAAIGGYGRGSYAAQQDIAAGAEKKAEAEQRRMDMEAAKAQQAQVEQIIAQLPPEQQQRFRLLSAIGAKDQAAQVIAPAAKDPIKLGDALVDPETYQVIAQAPPEQMSPYQAAMVALEQQGLKLRAAELNKPGAAPAPDLQAIQDPSDPSKSIYIDTRTGQPYTVGGQIVRPASQRDAGAVFGQSKDLRAGFDKQIADVREVVTNYGKIENGFKEQSGPGDIAGIFGYMKLLDPTSVVREGEFATAANSGGVPDYIRARYNSLLNGEKLAPKQRQELLSAARSQIGPYRKRYEDTSAVYTDLAGKFGVDPATVVTPIQFPDMATPVAPTEPPKVFNPPYGVAPSSGSAAAAPQMQGGAFTADDILNEVLGR